MNEIYLIIEGEDGGAFTIDIDDVVEAELSHSEIMEISDAVRQLDIPIEGRQSAVWDRNTKTLTIL